MHQVTDFSVIWFFYDAIIVTSKVTSSTYSTPLLPTSLLLVASGVPGSRMTAIGYGSSRPAVPNDTETNRALNRRVQLEISPNAKIRAQNSGNN